MTDTTPNYKKHFLELIRRTSTQLPNDVASAITKATRKERTGTPAKGALHVIKDNISLASTASTPLCQDTGVHIWYVYHPKSVAPESLHKAIVAATRAATRKSYLRPNAVHPITGRNSGDNIGTGVPTIHFHQWHKKTVAADLMFKGGGCENVSTQYTLPHPYLHAGRDLDGVRKVVLDAIFSAQGRGCGPGIIGLAIGGDRGNSMVEAKRQLFRPLDDKNPDKHLSKLETRLYKEANQLGIGPMGYGGNTTVLGIKAGWLHRLPASYFVSVAYMCWACRRQSVSISPAGNVKFSEVTVTGQKPIAAKGRY